MAANIFGRYVWLIEILRRGQHLTYEEINNRWKESGLSYGDIDNLPLRTFHNHRKAIFDIFDVDIKCDKNGYKYYIDDYELQQLEDDSLRGWLIDSYSMLNQLQADRKLQNRIQFEDIPSGHTFLASMVEAMRKNAVIEITHQGFEKEHSNTFEIEPYFMKVFNRRWYVIARSVYNDKMRTYALDRILKVVQTDKQFIIPEEFDINDYFDGCCGIIADKSIPKERVVIKVYAYARNYLKTLPLHSSQKQIAEDDESTTFEYNVRPTFDFLQGILCQADQIEVLEPESVRKEMKRFAENSLSYYKRKK